MNDRRKFLAHTGAAALGATLPFGLLHAATPLTVGFVYVGPRDDFGYNQSHAQAAAILKKIPGVKVIEEENVPETNVAQKVMEAMIVQDGASLIFATSYGYFDPCASPIAAVCGPRASIR
jgi:simple sugar transport system substrate-binding protein